MTERQHQNNQNDPDEGYTNSWGFRFKPEVNLGNLIQTFIFLLAIASAWFTYTARVDTTRDNVTQFRIETNQQLGDIRQSISNLPDVRAELVQIERRLDQADSRNAAQSARLEQIGEMAITTRSDVDNILRSSAAQVGRRAP